MKKILFLLITAVCAFTACKKMDEPGEAPRLFRPQKATELAADSNTIAASWLKMTEAKSYLVQLSRDTFKTVDVSLTTDTSVVVFKKLLFNQLYQIQVKAVAPDTAKNSKWSYLGAVKTLSSILKTPAIDDITFNSVRVKWTTKGAPVSSIKILKAVDSSVAAQVNLSVTDVTNEYKIINGLTADTRYIIYLYSGADERGYVSFNTKAPFTGTVIDLTGITGRASVLLDTLPAVPSGSTVLLKRGEIYNINSAYAINKSLIIMSGPDLANTTQAKIFLTSNFAFAAGSTIDSVEFNDVYMYSDNYSSRYIFNNTNSANVGKLKFMNSRMEIFRGMVRLQSGTLNLGSLIINNSIVDSIGNFGMINIAASSKIDNILLTNSTFYKLEFALSSASNSTSMLVDNCTFNESPLGNNKNYYFDWGSLNVTNGITVINSIFGPGKNSNSAFTVKGLRAGGSTVIGASNNYRTSDYVSGGNDVPNIATYNRTAVQLWQDVTNGNFKIMDATFPGRNTAGDPRWRP
jgi:hypothetical protein